MTERELRKLRRGELAEMLKTQIRENEELKAQIMTLVDQVNNRKLMLNEAGSIAEAALEVNKVVEAAQKAGDQYLENLVRLNEEREKECNRIRQEAESECQKLREETELQCWKMRQKAEQECTQMRQQTEEECYQMRQNAKKKCEEVFSFVKQMIEERI